MGWNRNVYDIALPYRFTSLKRGIRCHETLSVVSVASQSVSGINEHIIHTNSFDPQVQDNMQKCKLALKR